MVTEFQGSGYSEDLSLRDVDLPLDLSISKNRNENDNPRPLSYSHLSQSEKTQASKDIFPSQNIVPKLQILESMAQPTRSSSFPFQDIKTIISYPAHQGESIESQTHINDEDLENNLEEKCDQNATANIKSMLSSWKMSENLNPDIISEEIQLTQQNDKWQRNSWRKALKTSGYSSLLSVERIGSQVGSSFHNLFHSLSGSCSGLEYSRIDHVNMSPSMPNTVGCMQGLVTLI